MRLKLEGAQVVERRADLAQQQPAKPNGPVLGAPPVGFEWATGVF